MKYPPPSNTASKIARIFHGCSRNTSRAPPIFVPSLLVAGTSISDRTPDGLPSSVTTAVCFPLDSSLSSGIGFLLTSFVAGSCVPQGREEHEFHKVVDVR